MTWDEYQREALRTAAPCTSDRERLLILALGVCGESAEVVAALTASRHKPDCVVKELGDVCWYLACLADLRGVDVPVMPELTYINIDLRGLVAEPRLVLELVATAGALAEAVKKHVAQGHPLPRAELAHLLADCLYAVSAAAQLSGSTLGEVCESNIKKLRARYPGKFSVDLSLGRQEHE